MKLNHVALVCSSEKRADDFYQGILGLRKLKASVLSKELSAGIFGIETECLFFLYANNQCRVEVFVADQPRQEKRLFEHICLEVQDREAFVEKCRSINVHVNIVPRDDRSLVFVKDFDGNLFEIKEGEK